jgi:hypothetical protein
VRARIGTGTNPKRRATWPAGHFSFTEKIVAGNQTRIIQTKAVSIIKYQSLIAGMAAALAAAGASARSINLTGIYTCVDMCRGNQPAHITQDGPALNLLTEAGVPAQAWPDWFAPASRIWIDTFSQGAVYSPDGTVIQFDNGTIWHRGLLPLRRR